MNNKFFLLHLGRPKLHQIQVHAVEKFYFSAQNAAHFTQGIRKFCGKKHAKEQIVETFTGGIPTSIVSLLVIKFYVVAPSIIEI